MVKETRERISPDCQIVFFFDCIYKYSTCVLGSVCFPVDLPTDNDSLINVCCEFASIIVTGRNEVVAKVMFLLVSVILLTGGICPSACWDTTHPPGADTPPGADPPPPRSRHPPREQTPAYGQ